MLPFRSSFFKIPKHRQFKYKPRYYDAEKELRDQAKHNLEQKKTEGGTYIAERWKTRKNHNAANRRVIILAALLILLVYLILR